MSKVVGPMADFSELSIPRSCTPGALEGKCSRFSTKRTLKKKQKDIEKLVLCFLPLFPACTPLFSFQKEANNVEKQCGWGTFSHHSKFMALVGQEEEGI